MKYLIAFLLLFSASSAVARTLEIKMSQCPKPYVDNLREMTSNLGHTDELILNFDKAGKYEFDGSLKFRCNTTIKGVNSETTRVIVKEGYANGKSKMLDDTFFAVHGTSDNKVKVVVRDIRFELASHKGTLWENAPKHIVKVCDGGGVTVDNVTFWSTDAVITHVDLRECCDVVVENCTFENYNNCEAGGCLWSRGKQENIVVRNNVFSKYGKDEALAFWGGNNHKASDTSHMRDITVDNNEFYFGNKIKSKKDWVMTVLICFYHFADNHTKEKCVVENLSFINNKITIDAPTIRNIWFNFDALATVSGIEISNNIINNTSKVSGKSNYLSDISISTAHNTDSPIVVNKNKVKTSGQVLCDGKNSGYTFLSMENANVNIDNNVVNSDYGVRLIWCRGSNNNITMTNNQAFGLDKTAVLSANKSNGSVSLSSFSNNLNGDTRIYCNNIKNLALVFKNNVINSTDYHFFLQEAAEQTSITFEDNVVNAKKGKGSIYANYSGVNYNFNNVTISNNTFNGLKKADISEPFNKVKKLKMNNNIYR